MECVKIYILTSSFLMTFSIGSPVTLESVEWKFSRRLYDYSQYSAITLDQVHLPPHTISVNLSLNAFANDESCASRTVDIYANQFGIPVVSRDGESFPNGSFTPKMVANMSTVSNNETVNWVIADLQEGVLFIMGVLPRDNKRIQQKGLYVECKYRMSLRFLITYYAEDSVPLLQDQDPSDYLIESSSKKLIGFRIPADTLSYELKVDGCTQQNCKVKISLWDVLKPNMWIDPETHCMLQDGTCVLKKQYPRSESYSYLGLNVLSSFSVTVNITLMINKCTQNNKMNHTVPNSGTCVLQLSRELPEEAGSNSFSDRFVIGNSLMQKPSKVISVEAPEDSMNVLSFHLRTGDTGGSMNIALQKPNSLKSKSKVNVEMLLCASPYRIKLPNQCSDALSLKINSLSEKKEVKEMVPYPPTGTWYLSIQSRCFNGRSNTTVNCNQTVMANLTISMASCVDNGCNNHGDCKLYVETDLLYSACDCGGGWRGYGCTDDKNVEGSISIYLLTISNVAFIPGIFVALYRRFYIEAFVYTCNMFFSTFYHACDSSPSYRLCLLTYEAHSFADFFASLMSFVVTLLAMSRISLQWRSFLHMMAAMLIAVAEVYNRHGLPEQLTPIASGLGLVAVSWGYEMHKRKALFPSKRRYLFFIVPGLALAIIGLSFNLALETDDNYKYVHSVWHILVASAIVFLLPPRRDQKSHQPLSIRSGDVRSLDEGLLDSDSHLTNYHNADDPNTPPASRTTSLNFDRRPTNRSQDNQNFVM